MDSSAAAAVSTATAAHGAMVFTSALHANMGSLGACIVFSAGGATILQVKGVADWLIIARFGAEANEFFRHGGFLACFALRLVGLVWAFGGTLRTSLHLANLGL